MKNPALIPSSCQMKALYFGILIFLAINRCSSTIVVDQEDNDFVFEDNDIRVIPNPKINSSDQNVHGFTNVVPLGNDILVNSQDGGGSYEESLSERISQHFDRFKRDIGDYFKDFFGGPPTTPDQPVSSGSTVDESKTTRFVRQTSKESEDDGDDVEDDGPDDNSTEGDDNVESFSGSPIPPTQVTPSLDSTKTYFRIYIKLGEPFIYDFNDHSSTLFQEYSRNVTWAFGQLLSSPDFTKVTLINVISTADLQACKAIIDLEISGKESKDQIEGKLYKYLEEEGKLGTLKAFSNDLYVRDFEDVVPFQCSSDIPCRDVDICHTPSQRCNGHEDCPDHSDEQDCPPSDRCRSDEKYSCPDGSGVVICGIEKCDGKKDCPSGADEQSCSPENNPECLDDEFKCGSYCAPKSLRCNGVIECDDGKDEVDCVPTSTTTQATPPVTPEVECGVAEFKCDNKCIAFNQKCDNITDCRDGTDEAECPKLPTTTPWSIICNGTEFICDNTCKPIYKRCNGQADCYDGTDEQDCPTDPPAPPTDPSTTSPVPQTRPPTVPPSPATPGNGACRREEIKCHDGACIDSSKRCDNVRDCSGGEDELDCDFNNVITPEPPPTPAPAPRGCRSDEFTCDDGHCIPSFRKCDGQADCRDRSDELRCRPECRYDEFQCSDGYCIPSFKKCDFAWDCRDGSDEYGCPTTTTSTTPSTPVTFRCNIREFRCSDGHCIPLERRCDGFADCRDGSDESYGCLRQPEGQLFLKAYPKEQIIKESQEVVFQCRDEGSLRAPITWTRSGEQPLPVNSRVRSDGRLEIPNIQLSQAGTYICKANEPYSRLPGSQISVELEVEPFKPQTAPPLVFCNANQSTCLNGQCIPKEFVCNGQFDCADGSDEMRCKPLGCEPDQFRCDNGACVQKNWRCDGEDDCKDKSDETNCTPNPPGSPCRYDEFQCTRSLQCIPKAFQCDQHADCNDQTDEIGCTEVSFIESPRPMMTLTVGETFIITCTAYGVPTPEIVWRLNWGHVPQKCRSTSVNGTGTLICPNIQSADQGAYSCEAINSRGFKIARPDCILIVKEITNGPVSCPPRQFNNLATDTRECIDCFCFGQSTECKSSGLSVSVIQVPLRGRSDQIAKVSYKSSFGEISVSSDSNSITSLQTSVERDGLRVSGELDGFDSSTYPYLDLSQDFGGHQMRSYGGYIRFSVKYNADPDVNSPLIIISGNGNKIFYNGTEYVSGSEKTSLESGHGEIRARVFYGAWFREGSGSNEGDIPSIVAPTLASREDIMKIIANIDQILIKLQYSSSQQIDTLVSNIRIDSARGTSLESNKAVYVEECKCPPGYIGLSCERCDTGYRRIDDGNLGSCIAESCPDGQFGDPLRGIQCKDCPCPSSNPTNQFGHTCYLGADKRAVCHCPAGYSGRYCQYCAEGYTGDPLTPGSYCQPITSSCNPDGTRTRNPDGSCVCKEYATGSRCDQCKAGSFYLAVTNPYGCINCFCMGVTKDCSSSQLFRTQITSSFYRGAEEFKIVRQQDIASPVDTLEPRSNEGELVYSSFRPSDDSVYYWSLPKRYLGDKVTSYGGVLNYTVVFVSTPEGSSFRNVEADVEIISNNQIHLRYFKRDYVLRPSTPETVSVSLFEQYWQREDGQEANREHVLMALADLRSILIKATYTNGTQAVRLSNVVLESAVEYNTGLRRAYEVEECRCPAGYKGLSCQQCDAGYYRVESLYLNSCQRCNCNGYSNECEVESGICLNCANHTAGPDCGQCEPDYVGNPKQGIPCTPGNINRDCNCDRRGSFFPNCERGSCFCKPNAIGEHCDTCAPGTFDLQEDHGGGCLECWCSGVTTNCGSSNLYITQIPMPILGPNHGFTLTSEDRFEVIRDGFQWELAENRIYFDYRQARGQRLYWSLPPQFTGNKVSSYGGYLNWTQSYTSPADATSFSSYDLILYGGGTSLFWRSETPFVGEGGASFAVKLNENTDFVRVMQIGTERANRADIMTVLASLDAILIRATHKVPTTTVYLSDVSMDTAVGQAVSSTRATHVELCRCPPAFRGASCEFCSRGYYRDEYASPRDKCKKCPCSDREDSCALENGQVVCKCRAGYSGANCEGDDHQPLIVVSITEPALKIVAVGETIRYNCRARSLTNSSVIIKWSKEGGSLPVARSIDDGSGILVIFNAKPEDSGVYLCTATLNDFTRIPYSQRVTLTVGNLSPPKVSMTPSGTVTVNVGQPLTVLCEASGTPAPSIEFTRPEGFSIENRKPTQAQLRTELVIPSASKSDEGIYYCRAKNTQGYEIQSITVVVNDNVVIDPNDVRVSVYPSVYNGLPGETVRLVCSVPQDTYSVRLKWTRYPNLPLQSNAVETNGELIIYSATSQDTNVYICTATSIQSSTVLNQAQVSVNIGGSVGPAILRTDPERQTVPQGTVAVIRCIVNNNSDNRVTWRKSNGTLSPYAQTIGNELRISQLAINDRGVYVCEHGTGNDLVWSYAMLEVEPREIPALEIYPGEKQTAVVGGTAFLQCRPTAGEPSPEVRWSRGNNQPFSRDVEERAGVLRFNAISEEDEGQYICTARNVVGSVSSVAELIVASKPTITVYPRGPFKIPIGGRLRVECSARGKPTPNVNWLDPFYGSAPRVLQQTAVFEISRAEVTDSKEYICRAENSAGVTEERIRVFVSDQEAPPSIFEPSTAPDEEIIFPPGSDANLRCNIGILPEDYVVRWIKEGDELPSNHRIVDDDLRLYSLSKAHAGKYSCLGVGNNNEILVSKSIILKVIGGPPKIKLNPPQQVVRPGDNANVVCEAEGDQPIHIHWSTESGAPFTRSVTSEDGLLKFRGITVRDAGRYVCTASNIGGTVKGTANVIVSEINRPQRPVITAEDHDQYTFEGYSVDLRCVVDNNYRYNITWRRDNGPLPRNSQIFGETLRLINLRPEDADRYVCEVSTSAGLSRDYINVHVARISNVSLSIEANQDKIKRGDMVTLLCHVNGESEGNVIWSKVQGSFGANVRVDGKILKIIDVQGANEGIYRCSMHFKGGLKSEDYVIQLEPENIIATAAIDTKTIKQGENIDFDCATDLEPPVNYSWIVHSYDKSARRIVNSEKISILNASVNESGLYTCSASNDKAVLSIPRVLVVTNVIPAFSRNSYLKFRPLTNAENYFVIEITFRPKSDSGLILYNGQFNNGSGDYIAFGLNYGVPEFRFELGSGFEPAVIRSVTPLRLNTWHKVRLIRDRKEGIMELNGIQNISTIAPGPFERLDLGLPLFVGGLENEAVYNSTGFVNGFEGCVNRLVINGRSLDLKKEAIYAHNPEDCDNCRNNPCQNNGVCQQTNTATGYTCVCLRGFSGDNCQLSKEICYLDSCGPGKCIEHENGIKCQCPIGKTGEKCKRSIDIETPAFLKDSMLAYQIPLLKKRVKFAIKLKPIGDPYVKDGLILYIAENEAATGDFISLSIIGGFPELRFKVLSKPVTLRSKVYVTSNEEIEMNVTIDSTQAQFTVAGLPSIAEVFNPLSESAELKLNTPLYVGGYDKSVTTLPEELSGLSGLNGCVSMLDVSGTNIKLVQSSVRSININDCYSTFGDICRSKTPCQNNGICKTTKDTYKCECLFGYNGVNCERQRDLCDVLKPCLNNAKCVGNADSYKCHCDLGFTGLNCEINTQIQENIQLNGDGYVELEGSLIPREGVNIDIYMKFTTRSNEALLLWIGQNRIINGREYDYIAIGIVNGYVQLSIRADGYERTLSATDHRVNDGEQHTIRMTRMKDQVVFALDTKTEEVATVESRFRLNGDLFLGGSPDSQMTGNLYRKGFEGCIHELRLQNSSPIDFGTKAKSARNAAPCAIWYRESNSIN